VRLDSNDYSAHLCVIGRRIDIDLHRVRVFCDGRLVADHERLWAKHQTIHDPNAWPPVGAELVIHGCGLQRFGWWLSGMIVGRGGSTAVSPLPGGHGLV
jgi:hypothetical protein